MQKILIADPNTSFSNQLIEHLKSDFEVFSCVDGAAALRLMQNEKPDILIMDLVLPEIDGITLLREMEQLENMPTVIVASLFVNDFIVQQIAKYPIGYMFRKPCSPALLVERLQEMLSCSFLPSKKIISDRDRVANFLISLGFSTKAKGYGLLREAILMLSEDPTMAMTKELYPSLVKMAGPPSNSLQVERAMRISIEKAWKTRDVLLWSKYFPHQNWIRRPSNTTFLFCAADYLFPDKVADSQSCCGFLH